MNAKFETTPRFTILTESSTTKGVTSKVWSIYDHGRLVQTWTHKPSAVAECKRLNAKAKAGA